MLRIKDGAMQIHLLQTVNGTISKTIPIKSSKFGSSLRMRYSSDIFPIRVHLIENKEMSKIKAETSYAFKAVTSENILLIIFKVSRSTENLHVTLRRKRISLKRQK